MPFPGNTGANQSSVCLKTRWTCLRDYLGRFHRPCRHIFTIKVKQAVDLGSVDLGHWQQYTENWLVTLTLSLQWWCTIVMFEGRLYPWVKKNANKYLGKTQLTVVSVQFKNIHWKSSSFLVPLYDCLEVKQSHQLVYCNDTLSVTPTCWLEGW